MQISQVPPRRLRELTRFLLLSINGKEGRHGSGPTTEQLQCGRLRNYRQASVATCQKMDPESCVLCSYPLNTGRAKIVFDLKPRCVSDLCVNLIADYHVLYFQEKSKKVQPNLTCPVHIYSLEMFQGKKP